MTDGAGYTSTGWTVHAIREAEEAEAGGWIRSRCGIRVRRIVGVDFRAGSGDSCRRCAAKFTRAEDY